MSMQSDIEILSVQTMEVYAKRNHISGEDALKLFHKYKVIENIMIQHEYLHQVDFEEVMECRTADKRGVERTAIVSWQRRKFSGC